MEPLPASSPTRLPKSSSNARPAEPRAAVAALTLLKHAFGKSMLAATDEWHDVAEVVRSSFLIVSKEIKCQDTRLRVLEDNQQQQQMEREERDRWSVERLTEQWCAYAEHDARIKHKIAEATRAIETKASRDELQVEMLRLETRVNERLNTQNTQFALAEHELQERSESGSRRKRMDQRRNVQTAARPKAVPTGDQATSTGVLRDVQQPLWYCAAIKDNRDDVSNEQQPEMASTVNEATCTKPAHKNIGDVDKSETEGHCKSTQGRELVPLSHGGISHNASVPLPAVKPTHASLKQRFEDARLKQQACLTRLRQANY
ncbi:hypothetical protein FI667_g15508, partial [Globisporangium splendens]